MPHRRGRRPSLLVTVCAVLVALVAVAIGLAHTGGSTGFASIDVQAGAVRYRLTLSPTALPPQAVDLLRSA